MTQDEERSKELQELVALVGDLASNHRLTLERHEKLFIEALQAAHTHSTAILSLRQDLKKFCDVVSVQSKMLNALQDAVVQIQKVLAVDDVIPPAPPSAAN